MKLLIFIVVVLALALVFAAGSIILERDTANKWKTLYFDEVRELNRLQKICENSFSEADKLRADVKELQKRIEILAEDDDV